MPFEVKTPALAQSLADLRHAADGLRAGSIEAKDANALSGAADKTRRVVETELKVRLSAPKLAALEAASAA